MSENLAKQVDVWEKKYDSYKKAFLADGKITREEAAALKTIQDKLTALKTAAKARQGAGAGVGAGADPKIDKKHQSEATYTKVAVDLFVKGKTDTNAIDPNDVKQGKLANCYFLAAVAAVARAKPEALKKLIKKNGDGTYDVTLYVHDKWLSVNRKPKIIKKVEPTFPLDKDGKPIYAKMGDKELWVMLLEKAYAMHKGSYSKSAWGNPEDAIEALGGKDASGHKLSGLSDKEILEKVKHAIDNKLPITASSKKLEGKKAIAAGEHHIVGSHSYSVRGIKGGKIDLDNPWGTGDILLPPAVLRTYFDDFDIAEE